VKFACVDGRLRRPLVDFDDLMFRLQRYKATEPEANEKFNENCGCAPYGRGRSRLTMETQRPRKRKDDPHDPQARTPAHEQDPKQRARNFEEVTAGTSSRTRSSSGALPDVPGAALRQRLP